MAEESNKTGEVRLSTGKYGPGDEEKLIADLHKQYRTDRLPICPKCNNRDNVIPSMMGLPTWELLVYAQAGHAELLGCCPEPSKPMKRGKCKKCETDIFSDQNW